MKTTKSNYTNLKTIINLSNNLGIDNRELAENIGSSDFIVDNYRFILVDDIDQIQQDELSQDLWMLGCFKDWFIADNTDLSLNVVQVLQKAEAYEELGELMIDHIESIQQDYANQDGYGHHFAHYDHEEYEITIDNCDYYYFRIT